MEVKEFKEAIMFLENTLYMCIRGENEMPGYKVKYNHWIRKVISLLQQGEALKAENVELKAYKAIVEGFKEIFYTNPHNWVTKEYYADEIRKLEQKYLKEAKADETNNRRSAVK